MAAEVPWYGPFYKRKRYGGWDCSPPHPEGAGSLTAQRLVLLTQQADQHDQPLEPGVRLVQRVAGGSARKQSQSVEPVRVLPRPGVHDPDAHRHEQRHHKHQRHCADSQFFIRIEPSFPF